MFYLVFMNVIYRGAGMVYPHYKRYLIEIPYKVYNFRNTLKV